MIQLLKNLGGTVWLQYDRELRTWAAAKGVKIWGELNLSIYGHCLAAHQRPPTFPKPALQKRGYDRRDDKKLAKGRQQNCCYKWNFDGSCHTNLPQHVAISMHAILVVKITGQWSTLPCFKVDEGILVCPVLFCILFIILT